MNIVPRNSELAVDRFSLTQPNPPVIKSRKQHKRWLNYCYRYTFIVWFRINPMSTERHLPYGIASSHSVTCHPTQVEAPALTPARQAGARFIYPRGMEGWVDLCNLIAARPGIEPCTTAWSQVRRSNRYVTKVIEETWRNYTNNSTVHGCCMRGGHGAMGNTCMEINKRPSELHL